MFPPGVRPPRHRGGTLSDFAPSHRFITIAVMGCRVKAAAFGAPGIVDRLAAEDFGKPLQTGEFGAHMLVSLTNDGPVTIIIDSKNPE